MDLIFWRHAEAEDWTEGCDDMQRSLTGRGEKQAKRMAAWLDRQLPEGTRIVCSPARRCEQTALALGRKYKLRSELAPDTTGWSFVEATKLLVPNVPNSNKTFDDVAKLVDGHVGDQPDVGEPGRVDDDIYRSGLPEEPLYGGLVGDVDRGGGVRGAQFGGPALCRVGVEVGDGDPVLLGCQRLRRRPADPGRSADHDRAPLITVAHAGRPFDGELERVLT